MSKKVDDSHNSTSHSEVPDYVKFFDHDTCLTFVMTKPMPYEHVKKEENSDFYHVYFEYFQFEETSPSMVKLNKIIQHLVFDDFNSSKEYFDDFLLQNKKMLHSVDPESFTKWEDVEKVTLILNTENIISFVHDDYGWQEGSPIGYGTEEVYNYDVKKGELIKSNELIDPTKVAALEHLLETNYRFNLNAEDAKKPLKLLGWNKNKMMVAENITIEEQGLNFVYHRFENHTEHESLEIFVPYESMADIIKKGSPLAMNLIGE